MISRADDIKGQGVGSAYIEQVNLLKNYASDIFEITVNKFKKSDITHFHTVNFSHYIRLIFSKNITVTYVHFLPHTLDGSIKLPKLIFNIFKKYVVKFYRDSDYLVVVNPIFIDELSRYNISKEKICYIPNYVSKETFYKLDDNINGINKSLYHIDLNKKVVLSAGQIQTRKGVLDFIDVAKKMPDVEFIWCGGFSFGNITDGYKELKSIVENPPKNVSFPGIIDRDKMNEMFNVADVIFMPSYNELFPMTILEAVNCEKPLVLRDLELYEDILFDKYLKGNNNDEFVQLLNDVLYNEETYDKYMQLSNEISKYYSQENVVKIWKDFYTKIYNDAL